MHDLDEVADEPVGSRGNRPASQQHYDWAMLEVTSDDTRWPRRQAQCPAGAAAPLHRPAVVLPVLDTWAGPAVQACPLARAGRFLCRPAAAITLILLSS